MDCRPIDYLLPVVLEGIEAANRQHGQKLRKRIAVMGPEYFRRVQNYFAEYDTALRTQGKSIQFAVECYLKMCDDMLEERLAFLRTGAYSNQSFREVECRIYGNPAVMEYHIHGLGLAQFLWLDQYERLRFFCDGLPAYAKQIGDYLEIGGGHGLYAKEALGLLPAMARIDVLDISASSLAHARQLIGPSRINYVLDDIYCFETKRRYDFITIAEVIEHVEKPVELLARVSSLLAENGAVYLTTPANAPMIDHIYLFKSTREIRDLIVTAGFSIAAERVVVSEDVSEEVAEEKKIPIMYAAFLRRAPA